MKCLVFSPNSCSTGDSKHSTDKAYEENKRKEVIDMAEKGAMHFLLAFIWLVTSIRGKHELMYKSAKF